MEEGDIARAFLDIAGRAEPFTPKQSRGVMKLTAELAKLRDLVDALRAKVTSQPCCAGCDGYECDKHDGWEPKR